MKAAANGANPLATIGVLLLFGMLFFPGSCIGGVAMLLVAQAILGDAGQSAWKMFVGVLLLSIGLGAPCMAALALSDAWQRRLLRKQIKSLGCTVCGYSLLGLRPVAGAVTCPECGTRHALTDLGITDETLLTLTPDAGGPLPG